MASQQPTLPSSERAILIYWRMPRPDGRAFVCTSYRTVAGLELRAGVQGDVALFHAAVATHAEAQRLAEIWRQQITSAAA